MKKILFFYLLIFGFLGCIQKSETISAPITSESHEKFRPQYHFSPLSGWMNDPNGLVYHDGLYHLFFQYYPNATVWGPMHWGHAVSKDLVSWQHKPIALFPDEKGAIFSGSAVVDHNNSSGFGKAGEIPLVALFTYFSMEKEKKGLVNTQTQGLAYSLDNGESWTKYGGNPVIDNQELKDFRDPKVFWHEETKSWIMALVAGDHAKFYRSKNLKNWDNISDFGQDQGAHGGVWECPDLFPLKVEGSDEEKWVLIISIGSGAPNGGSGTQYFVGDFDGTTFTSEQSIFKWLDWGTDNYAGVTYNDAPDGKRKFIGWMSNWQYALKTPTENWRSSMTLARELTLKKIDGEYVLVNYPVSAIATILDNGEAKMVDLAPNSIDSLLYEGLNQSKITMTLPKADLMVTFSNDEGEKFSFIYEAASNTVMTDRTKSGETDFNNDFGNKLHYMILNDKTSETIKWEVFLDQSSCELFLNEGENVMTEQLFPSTPYQTIEIKNLSRDTIQVQGLKIQPINSIWK